MNRCLSCYQPLPDEFNDFHPACSRKMFGRTLLPILPYSLDTMHELAEQIVRQSITVTGVQPKISLDLERKAGTNQRQLVGLWGRYILKPPYALYPQMPEVEDVTMHLAKHFGIQTVPHTLIRLQTGELSYLTRRIDRATNGQKRAMEDCCQLAERLTADKYKGSMELVARLIRQHSHQRTLDLVTLYELTLFCFLTGNADMHLKNFSLWRTPDGVSLTPAYDLVATKLLLPSDPEELALTLNGKKSRLAQTDWKTYSDYLELTTKQRANILNRFRQRLPTAFDWIERSFLSDTLKHEYRTLLIQRADRLGL